MAKVVIAGRSDCPYYARIELLADRLSRNLPDFQLHKIVKQPTEWNSWLAALCAERGWKHAKSPITWRELIDRGGKGILIGGSNEFQEYVHGYYGLKSDFTTSDMQKVAEENVTYKNLTDKEDDHFRSLSHPMRVCVTNASYPACYGLVQAIARGEVFGDSTEISLQLLDDGVNMDSAEGLKMEAEDLACGLLREINVTADPYEAFENCAAIIVLDELERADHSVEDWLKKVAEQCINRIQAIERVSLDSTKILVASNGPTNFMVDMMIRNMQKLSPKNIVAMPRLIENQAKAIISRKVNVNSADVVDVIVWGNTSGKYYCDLEHARVHNHDGPIWGPPFYSRLASLLIHEDKWLHQQFHDALKVRRIEEREKLGRNPSLALSSAIVSLMTHWWNSGPSDQIFSLGVRSEGWYGIPDGIVFNFPVKLESGTWSVVENLILSDAVKARLQECLQDLMEQQYVVFPELRPPPPPKPPSPQPASHPTGSSEALTGSLLPAIREESDEGSLTQPATTDPDNSGNEYPETKVGEETTVINKEGNNDETTVDETTADDSAAADEPAELKTAQREPNAEEADLFS